MSILPGLPDLPSDVSSLFSAIAALTSDVVGVGDSPSQWGIFLNGAAVVQADNVVSVEYKQDFSISDYPVEQGGFSSYNKVQHPQELLLRFSTGGSVADRTAFLASIAAIIGDTNLYDVVTPEATYTNLNLTHQDYRREASKGLGLVVVDIRCEEVRSASLSISSSNTSSGTSAGSSSAVTRGADLPDLSQPSSFINNPQSPSASPQVNGGNVQPVQPTAAQSATFDANAASGTGFDF